MSTRWRHPRARRPAATPPWLAASLAACLAAAPGTRPCAAQTLSLSWAPCDVPPVLAATVVPQQTTGANLYVFASGMSQPTIGYSVQITYTDESGAEPDAWRFDDNGCQGTTLLAVNHLAPSAVSKACPSFATAGGASAVLTTTTVDFRPLPTVVTHNALCITLAVATTPNAPQAGTTYFLMDAEFNQLYGVYGPSNPAQFTCGGLESPMCFAIRDARYLLANNTEVPFPDLGWVTVQPQFGTSPPNFTATANWGGPGSCADTPARAATWGRVKAQYRN